MRSGYTVQNAGASGAVAIRGSFWADAETYDLLRVEFHAEEIPPELLDSDISTSIAYARVRIGESDALLPQTADLRVTDVDGLEKWNHIEFTHCQGFHAESTLRFGADEVAPAAGQPAAPAPPAEEATLPPGLRMAVALSAPLSGRAAAGSLIEGKVAAAVMHKGKVLVPEGALVKGRIRRLERYSDDGGYFIVALEFMRVETPSGGFRFYAELQDAGRPEGVETILGTARVSKQGEFRGFGQHPAWSPADRARIPARDVPGVGTFFVRGSRFTLPAGFQTVWKTQLYPGSAHP
jgi:hypothetical protein